MVCISLSSRVSMTIPLTSKPPPELSPGASKLEADCLRALETLKSSKCKLKTSRARAVPTPSPSGPSSRQDKLHSETAHLLLPLCGNPSASAPLRLPLCSCPSAAGLLPSAHLPPAHLELLLFGCPSALPLCGCPSAAASLRLPFCPLPLCGYLPPCPSAAAHLRLHLCQSFSASHIYQVSERSVPLVLTSITVAISSSSVG